MPDFLLRARSSTLWIATALVVSALWIIPLTVVFFSAPVSAQTIGERRREAVTREFARDPLLFSASFVVVVRDEVTSGTLTPAQYMGITSNFFLALNSMPDREAALEGIYDQNAQLRPVLGQAAQAIRRLRRIRGEQAVIRLREEEELFDGENEPSR